MEKTELVSVVKNIILVIFLFFIIFTIFLFLCFYISFNFTRPTNGINLMFRRPVLTNHVLRTVFRLNDIGDARYDLANAEPFQNLKINLYTQEGLEFSNKAIEEAIAEIRSTIADEKNITIGNVQNLQNIPNEVTDRDLNAIFKKHQPVFSLAKKSATLDIYLLKLYKPKPGYIGLTQNAHAIILFSDAMDDAAVGKTTRHDIEVSTILHEFAHLLGAEHTDDRGCILSEELESKSTHSWTFTTSYCHSDRLAIESAL